MFLIKFGDIGDVGYFTNIFSKLFAKRNRNNGFPKIIVEQKVMCTISGKSSTFSNETKMLTHEASRGLELYKVEKRQFAHESHITFYPYGCFSVTNKSSYFVCFT